MKPIEKGSDKFVVGEPQVGHGTKGMPKYFFDALITQGLSGTEIYRIWNRAGMDMNEMGKFFKYVVEAVDEDLVVLRYEDESDEGQTT